MLFFGANFNNKTKMVNKLKRESEMYKQVVLINLLFFKLKYVKHTFY